MVICLVPLASYVLPLSPSSRFPAAVLLTLLILFTIGASRAVVTELHWRLSGLEMFLVGAGAAVVAYGIGALVALIIGGQLDPLH